MAHRHTYTHTITSANAGDRHRIAPQRGSKVLVAVGVTYGSGAALGSLTGLKLFGSNDNDGTEEELQAVTSLLAADHLKWKFDDDAYEQIEIEPQGTANGTTNIPCVICAYYA